MPHPDPHQDPRRRRTIKLALIHVALAIAILAFFVWTQVSK